MVERSHLRLVAADRPVITVGRSAINDTYYVEVTPDRLQRDREFKARQCAIAHADRLRDLYGWRLLDLTRSAPDFP